MVIIKKTKYATIPVLPKTKKRLESLGRYKESYDSLLNRILDIFELKSADILVKEKTKGET